LSLQSKNKIEEHKSLEYWLPIILFLSITVLIGWDIAEDVAAETSRFHIVFEFLMMMAAPVGAYYFWNKLRIARLTERDLKQTIEHAHEEMTRWQEEEKDLIHNLRKAINKQFAEWNFSPKEKEIAFYLLEGLSLKEIAEVKGSTYLSVKQQAHVLYRSAGIGGRAELSAFFLGGLLESSEETGEAEPKGDR